MADKRAKRQAPAPETTVDTTPQPEPVYSSDNPGARTWEQVERERQAEERARGERD